MQRAIADRQQREAEDGSSKRDDVVFLLKRRPQFPFRFRFAACYYDCDRMRGKDGGNGGGDSRLGMERKDGAGKAKEQVGTKICVLDKLSEERLEEGPIDRIELKRR